MAETTVIIPTYNRLHFLKEAVASVFGQTYTNFELIVVDDGSTDGTRDFVAGLANPVRYVRQENAGPSSARNRGFVEARGEFITFLDSDDLWQPTKLAAQIALMRNEPEATVCYTDEIWIRRGKRINQGKRHRKYGGWIFEKCVPLCIVSPSSVLMRRAFFEEVGLFDEHLPACEDYDLWLRAALRFPFHFIPEKLIVKRGGQADQLSAQWGLDRYRVQALQKLLQEPKLTPSQRGLVLTQLTHKARILEKGFRKRGKTEEADYYQNVLRGSPRDF